MKTLTYKVIKTKTQYEDYCNQLETLLETEVNSKETEEELELLTLLIETWENQHNSFNDKDPVQLIKFLMDENNIKAIDLAKLLDVSKGMVSGILNYRKGLSKEIIRKLSSHFKLSQEAFNRPYKLKSELNRYHKNAGLMNTPKNMKTA